MKVIETEYKDGVYQPVSVVREAVKVKTVKQKKKEIRKAKVHKAVCAVDEFVTTFRKIYEGFGKL